MNNTNKRQLLKNSQPFTTELEEKSSRPGNLAFQVSRKKKLIDYAILIFSALLYSSAFPPLNWSLMAWFSVFPLFMMTRGQTARSAFIRAYLWGYVWALVSFFWLREIEVFIPFAMAFVLAFFPALWAIFIGFIERHLYYPKDVILNGFNSMSEFRAENQHSINWSIKDIHFCLLLSALWVFIEWIRSWIFTGFPWNLAATSQWQNLLVIQISDITGAYGVSFVIIMMNVSVGLTAGKLNTMISGGKFRRPAALYFSLIIIMLCIGYGLRAIMRQHSATNAKNLKVALIQPKIPQCRIPTEEQAEFAARTNLELIESSLASEPDIVVLPETAVPLPFRSNHPIARYFRRQITKYARENNLSFLIGVIEFGDTPFDRREIQDIPVHNSTILIGPEGEIIDKYHKIQLVPFGEYTPFSEYLEALKEYFGMGRNLTPGKDYTIFELPGGISAGVNICYEDVFPGISRKLTKKGAEVIFVITNDAWFPRSSQPEQHFAHSIFRAVENRRKIIRCGNYSFSSILSTVGAVEDSISRKRDPKTGSLIPAPEKRTRGYAVLDLQIPYKQSKTFYTVHGDIFVLACFLFLFISGLEIFWRWHKQREEIIQSFNNQPKLNNEERTS